MNGRAEHDSVLDDAPPPAAGAADSPPATTNRASDQVRPRTHRLSGGLAVAATIIGVLAGAATLFDWFGDKVNTPPPPAPTEIDARVLGVELRTRQQRLVDYLRETNQPTRGLSDFEGAEKGYVFTVRVRLVGNQGKPLPLRWSIIDTRTGTPLPGPTYNQTAVVFKPRGPKHSRTWPMWVPRPPRSGTYALRATLINEKRQPLDEADSDPFRF